MSEIKILFLQPMKAVERKSVQLWLDWVMWESRLYLNGELIGSEDSLCTPHTYELGMLAPGKHRLTLRIDNSGRPGANVHGYGEDHQVRWNGVVGRMELTASGPVYLANVRTIPVAKRTHPSRLRPERCAGV